MENLFRGVTESQKQIIKAVAPLVIIIFLFVLVGKFGFSRLNNLKTQVATAKKSQSVLTDKFNLLTTITPELSSSVSWLLYALPSSNPSLQVISQIKSLSAMYMVILQDIKCSSVAESKSLGYVITSFKVVGSKDAISAFTKGLDTIAPLTFLEKVSLSHGVETDSAEMTTKTYWAPLPSTIPTITAPITDLSTSEKELLSQIEKLTIPLFGQDIASSSASINENPFGI